jgi:hypothetical protein
MIKISGTVILPVVCYGFETWSLTFREEHRLRMSAKWMLRKIFGSKRDNIIEKWRRLRKVELYDLYFSRNIFRVIKSRRMRSAEHVARMGQRESAYRALVERLEGKRSFRMSKLRWEDNTQLVFFFKEWDGKASTGLVWFRIVTDGGLL